MLKKLNALKVGDRVSLVAPSSHFKSDDFLKGVSLLNAQGWICTYRSDIFSKHLYLAGSRERRSKELIEALTDPQIQAILFARGGYGAMHILKDLDQIRKVPKPKIVAGFSDATVILNYVQKRWKWPVFYSPNINSLVNKSLKKEYISRFFKELSGQNEYPQKIKSIQVLKPGNAEGDLIGGCLSLMSRLIGTKYDVSYQNKILFLEDVGEDPYSLDRMLTHMKLANKFKNIKAIIWGSLSEKKPQKDYLEMLKTVFKEDHFPVYYNFPAGHGRNFRTCVLGHKVKINGAKKSIEFLTSPFIYE